MTAVRRLALAAALCLSAVLTSSSSWWSAGSGLPESLSAADYWALVESLSEPDGYFQSDNLVSNEHSYQWVVPDLQERRRPNQVYLGVAPDQNFTYILAMQPRMAFIVDIRRGNLLVHLMYKAAFELSADRAEFLALLFSRPRPAGLSASSSIDDLIEAFAMVPRDELLFRDNLILLQHHLTTTRGFTLSDEDLRGLDEVYSQFSADGPFLTYTARGGFGAGTQGSLVPQGPVGPLTYRFRRTRFPTWGEMVRQTDSRGRQHSYLSSEEAFRTIKSFQENNLLIPVVGDHTGPKALKAVGRYIRERGGSVGAFYTSNVEQYLFRYGSWKRFAANLAELPLSASSVIIRSVAPRDGYRGTPQGPDGRANVLDPIVPLVRAAARGDIHTYRDVTSRAR